MSDLYSKWENTCNNIVSNEQTNWKSLDGVTYMLEHLPHFHAITYLDNLLKDNFPVDDIKHLVSLNDKYGGATLHNFKSDIVSSTSSIRYVRHALDICNHIKSKNIGEPLRIIEVGGGYGGLCLILNEYAKMHNVNIAEYHIYDIPHVQSLQKYYLKNFPDVYSKVTWKDCTTFGADIQSDMNNFIISNYCISEIPEEYRNNYLQNIIPKVAGGYMAWNYISTACLPENRIEEDENPKTGEHNKVIRF
jgi:hypothetical protein